MRVQATRWRILSLLVAGLALALCSACGSAGGTSSAGGHTYNAGAGQIVAQLFPVPGFVAIGIVGVPAWTLYGDGTVVYRGGPVGAATVSLQSGKLAQSQMDQLLHTMLDQDHFFATTRTSYGTLIPDVGGTRLTVNADGMSKSVSLQGNPGTDTDQETRNVFAVEDTLLNTHPANSTAYVAPGAALLVTSRAAIGQGNVTPWPYADVDLDQAYNISCGVTQLNDVCDSTAKSAGLYGVYGSRGRDVLGLVNGSIFQTQQGQYDYTVLAFPLLPDALVQQNGHAPGVLVNGTIRIPLEPAPPPTSK